LARNVKDRQNSKITVKNLEKICTELKNLKDKDLEMGLFIFSGTDTYGTDIFHIIRPRSKCNRSWYKCLNKFVTDNVYEYLKVYDGSITFADGNTFYIYVHGECGFEKVDYKKVDLGTRHNKGGQSQHRHERNFDIIKDYYIQTISEATVMLTTENNWIFGSLDIINKVIVKNSKLQNGGFIDFNKHTINDSKKWLGYLKDNLRVIKKQDQQLEQIVTLLETDPDRLDFNLINKDQVEWYMTIEELEEPAENAICLSTRHRYYAKLYPFGYIGVKFLGQTFTD
jgi:hypothetical protein